MKENNEEKGLTKIHIGLFGKLKKFFQNLLFGKQNTFVETYINTNNNENNFKENIQIKQEEKRILKLQQDFKQGIIEEEDIPEDDYTNLLKLYDEQNEKIRQEIEMYRKETAKILEQLKKVN